jgi:hypothetical protein
MTVDVRITERIKELERDGFVECVKGTWLLTNKGWTCLCAAAEGPITKPTGKPNRDALSEEKARSPLWGGLSGFRRPSPV